MEIFSNPIETLSVVCSLIFIAGIARRKIWAWAFGIIASALAMVLFFQEKLYSESYLQGFYVLLGVYGWWYWKTLNQKGESKNRISEWKLSIHFLLILSGVTLSVVTGWYFDTYTEAQLPYLDAFTTVFALVATVLEARKVLSCWYYWLVVNPVSVVLYLSKDLVLYSALGVVFSVLSAWGLREWRRAVRAEKS